MTLHDLSDDELVAQLNDICLDARRLDARLIGYLVEVEDRRLHLKEACSSLFDFCVRRLHMSEGAAFRRINAARLTRRFPTLAGHLERGRVHLSTLVLLRDHLTEWNVDELIAVTEGKSKREIEDLLARRAPRPDVPARLRKLPASKANRPSDTATATAAATAPSVDGTPADGTPPNGTPAYGTAAYGTAAYGTPAYGTPPYGTPPAPRAAAPARIEPLSDARYRLQLTLTAEMRGKLERAVNLMRYRNPTGDLAVVVDRALDALLAKLEKERLGKTTRPRRASPKNAPRHRPAGAVPTAVRREVFARDGEQCTFVDREGRRCTARAFLELDHVESRALGGSNHAANLRVLCRGHNGLHAEEVFGREYVSRAVRRRQRKPEPPHREYVLTPR
ncbi:MAG: hypothetical protein JWP87_4164 [Labilithrix sp.]|nr:hypothetical protein [Labilithrix sp.]